MGKGAKFADPSNGYLPFAPRDQWMQRRTWRTAMTHPRTPAVSRANEERAAVTAALLEATARLVAQTDAIALVQSMCEGLVAATPHIRLAWAWFGYPDMREIRPMVAAGPAKSYADSLVIERQALASMGPAFRALQQDDSAVASASHFSLHGPWRTAGGGAFGFEVAVAFPLHIPNARKRGVLVFYADDADYFDRVGQQPFAAFARLAEATLAQAELRAQLHRKATHDALTGLHNRAWLTEELDEMHANAVRYDRRYALMMFDLDGFKAINDRYGHALGDRAIAMAADIASQETRRGDVIGRWGGDEFLALLPESDTASAVAAAERIRAKLEAADLKTSGIPIPLRAGFGVAAYPLAATTIDDMLRVVDAALYVAKRGGGNRVAAAPLLSG
jgi:diguanylate cyclase (GGDEF)-like protein